MTELDKLLQEYLKTFGEGFPTYQVLRGRTEKESVAMIRRCIEEKKDAYELGYCTLDDDIEY